MTDRQSNPTGIVMINGQTVLATENTPYDSDSFKKYLGFFFTKFNTSYYSYEKRGVTEFDCKYLNLLANEVYFSENNESKLKH